MSDRDRIAAVVRAHRALDRALAGYGRTHCKCGWSGNNHWSHVTDELLAAGVTMHGSFSERCPNFVLVTDLHGARRAGAKGHQGGCW